MHEIVFPLPRKSNRGNPPHIILNRKILRRAHLSPVDRRSALHVMQGLYVQQERSQSEIASLFEVQPDTVRRWLRRLAIPLRDKYDCVSLAQTRFPVHGFDGSADDKAYLLGLRAGDLHAQVHGRRIRVSIGTTHPAMLELFQALFSRFGKVRRYPKTGCFSRYHWCVYCDLDESFSFMLKKPMAIPDWVRNDDQAFLSFLAGYFDAEGCISVDSRPGSHTVSWIVASCDYDILKGIADRLCRLGFNARFSLARAAGRQSNTQEYWCVRVGKRNSVMALLHMLRLRHREKIAKVQLVDNLVRTDWRGASAKVAHLRSSLNTKFSFRLRSPGKSWPEGPIH